jgi:redox-sensitive bicupin YhaK (pirin superfamily)
MGKEKPTKYSKLAVRNKMKVVKRSASEIQKEEAHGGSGARKVYASPEHLKSTYFEAMTYGYLPAGKTFDWHDHTDIEEISWLILLSSALASS